MTRRCDTLANPAPWLDGKQTVFGKVTSGVDVVDTLEALPTDHRDRRAGRAG